MTSRSLSLAWAAAFNFILLGQSVFGQIQTMSPMIAPTQPSYSSGYMNTLSPGAANSGITPEAVAPGTVPYDEPPSRLGLAANTMPAGTVAELPADAPIPPGLPPPSETLAAGPMQFVRPQSPMDSPIIFEEAWTWQFLPDGLLYKSYLAGQRESRFASQWVRERESWLWDIALGGHVGLVRLGTTNPIWPEGWQLDIEGAAFPRLSLAPATDRDLVATDFRFGIPLTVRQGPWEAKFSYYHLSSHLGDEYMVHYHTFDRINYVRDSLVLGVGLFPNPNLRLYAEADYAFNVDGGAEPWAFQFGAEFSPIYPTRLGGAPFVAVNGHLRQENDFGGNVCFETGWQWRGRSGHLTRFGFMYFNGMSEQTQFYDRFEEQIGLGLWYDY
ncbi:MAG: DUF1207 domain-containing protein [Pirellulales bacterium]|nr:DUF1207 domain-containing protein [Pirellulales bacterium]